MGLLRNENHKQNAEITSLKETVQSQNKTIHRHETVIKELVVITSKHKRMDDKSARNLRRNKRPYRLLPTYSRKNETDQQYHNRFYGPPTNCYDLTRLGYTLNGYYLVKPNNTETTIINNSGNGKNTKLRTIFCAFKQEGIFDESRVENVVSSQESIPTEIYFHAKKAKSFIARLYDALMFAKIISNVGEGFKENGLFVAPKSGIYHFIYKGAENRSTVDFYIQYKFASNKIKYDSIAPNKNMIQVTLKLKQGDSIFVKPADNRFTPEFPTEEIEGYLLKELEDNNGEFSNILSPPKPQSTYLY